MKLAVLMGGTSLEREVSLDSGAAISAACRELGHDVIDLELDGDIHSLIPDLKSVDLVFIGLHGTGGEDGVIQGFLDTLDIKYTGSGVESSAICMDKRVSKALVHRKGIKTPNWISIEKNETCVPPSKMKYPLVVKPSNQGSSIGLSIILEEAEFEEAVSLARQNAKTVLVEEYINGRELTAAVVGNEAYPLVEIIPTHNFYDYKCKYTSGMSKYFCPADLPDKTTDEMQSIALRTHQMFGCRHYSRIDFRVDEDENPWFLEVNTLPGMTSTSLVPKAAKAIGLSFEEFIQKVIEMALKE